jgi:hypothetical protein
MADTPEPENISTMSPERAGELLAQMTKEYNAAEAARKAGLTPSEPPRPTETANRSRRPPPIFSRRPNNATPGIWLRQKIIWNGTDFSRARRRSGLNCGR